MPRVKAQIVIGIAVLILSAAFLLTGVYFAQLQGLLFQNGANSLQLFANNMAAVKNALYTAPSSMSITLAGNSSMCKWSSAIDAYDCAGGSKVYNVSYASGPTLDTGTNMFSLAFCVMLTIGPGTGAADGAVEDGVTAASDVLKTLPEDELVDVGGGIVSKDFANLMQSVADEQSRAAITGAPEEVGAVSQTEELGTIAAEQDKNIKPFGVNPVTSVEEVQNSFLGSLAAGIKKVGLFIVAHPSLRSLLTNVGIYASSFWLGQTVGSLNSNMTKGLSIKGLNIPAFAAKTILSIGPLLSTYITGEPISSTTGSALNLQTIHYSQFLVASATLQNMPYTIQTYNALEDAIGEATVQQNIFNGLSAQSPNGASSNPYATPIGGVKVPYVLSSPNEFVGQAKFSSPNDPILSYASFLADEAFLVYGQTAVCLGVMPQSINVNDALSTTATMVGQALSPVNVYIKNNIITQLGTYFLGYGGEVYINGQSSGRPTAVGAPVITDQSDLCELATTSSQPGTNLQTMILPVNGGSVTLSVSQGLFNTMCSPNDVLFPQPVSDFINKILSTASPTENVSILLPPQYAIGITNSSQSSTICLYSVALDQTGSPLSTGFTSSFTEYGLPLSCFNIAALTGGKEHLIFTAGSNQGFELSGIGKDAFFLNNKSVIGFSIPPDSFIGGNFIPGPPLQVKETMGVDSPMANLVSSLIGRVINTSSVSKILNGLQISLGNNLMNYITSRISNPPGNDSYYPTEYTNLTFKVSRNSGNIDINLLSNNLIFGVYPNNYNSLGGTYGSGS